MDAKLMNKIASSRLMIHSLLDEVFDNSSSLSRQDQLVALQLDPKDSTPTVTSPTECLNSHCFTASITARRRAEAPERKIAQETLPVGATINWTVAEPRESRAFG